MERHDSATDAARFTPPGQAESVWDSLSSRCEVDLGGASDAGKVRLTNEDFFLIARFGRGIHTLQTNLPPGHVPAVYAENGYVLLVADGMGGGVGGEVASRTAISSLLELFIQTPDWIMRPDAARVPEVLRRMEERFGRLADVLSKRARLEPDLLGMGTTLTLAVSLGADLVIAHVGASRAYLFRRGHLLHLTNDQTVARLLADTGCIRHEDVPIHYARRLLTSSINAWGEKAAIELRHLTLMDGDRLLLCSDGLTELVEDARVSAVLAKRGPAADACRELVDLALKAGGRQNVTVALACYRIPAEGD